MIKISVMAALLAAAVGTAATNTGTEPTGSFECPNQGVKEIKSDFTLGPLQNCGVGLTVQGTGLGIHLPENKCPAFVIYEPVHYLPTPKKGHFATYNGSSPITIFYFTCSTRWLFGFLFPIGSHCVSTGSKNAGGVSNYIEQSCVPRFQRGVEGGRGEVKMPGLK